MRCDLNRTTILVVVYLFLVLAQLRLLLLIYGPVLGHQLTIIVKHSVCCDWNRTTILVVVYLFLVPVRLTLLLIYGPVLGHQLTIIAQHWVRCNWNRTTILVVVYLFLVPVRLRLLLLIYGPVLGHQLTIIAQHWVSWGCNWGCSPGNSKPLRSHRKLVMRMPLGMRSVNCMLRGRCMGCYVCNINMRLLPSNPRRFPTPKAECAAFASLICKLVTCINYLIKANFKWQVC